MKKTIFISAYRNYAVRYILRSDIFKQLKTQNINIVIFLKESDIEYYRAEFEDCNVTVEPVYFAAAMKLRGTRINSFFSTLRMCISGGNAEHRNATDQAMLVRYKNLFAYSWKAKIYFSVINALSAIGRKSLTFRTMLLQFENFLVPGKLYDAYFQKYTPNMLITSSYGYMIDPFFMRAAKRHGCMTVSIIHSWDNTTTKGYRGADPDHVIAWNKIMKKELIAFHDIPEHRVFVGGIAHWDFYFNGKFQPNTRTEFLQQNNLLENRKIIFYGLASDAMYSYSFDVLEQLLAIIQQGGLSESVQLLVRLHPLYLSKNKQEKSRVIEKYDGRINEISNKFADLVVFDLPELIRLKDDIDMPESDMHNLANTLHYTDIMLTEYSTLMIEGAIFDIPTINIALYYFQGTNMPAHHYESWEHIRRILNTGACKSAYDIQQLVDLINHYLRDSSSEKAERMRLLEQEVTTNKGNAGKSIANHIHSVIE